MLLLLLLFFFGCKYMWLFLTLNFLAAEVNTLNTQTHSCKETAEFCFKNAQVKKVSYCKQRMKSRQSLSSECVETKLRKPYTSFTSRLHSLCGMVWYRTLRVKPVREIVDAFFVGLLQFPLAFSHLCQEMNPQSTQSSSLTSLICAVVSHL